MSVYYNYALDGSNLVVLSYADDCIYWYIYKEIGKFCVDKIGNRLHVNFL